MHTNNKRRPNSMGGGSGQHRHHNNRNRRYSNNGGARMGENDAVNIARTRRHATQMKEKYLMMGRDMMSSGDRVQAENYFQHADHYHRVLLSLPPEEVRQPYHQRQSQDASGTHDMPAGEEQNQEDSTSSHATSHALPAFLTQGGGAQDESTHPDESRG